MICKLRALTKAFTSSDQLNLTLFAKPLNYYSHSYCCCRCCTNNLSMWYQPLAVKASKAAASPAFNVILPILKMHLEPLSMHQVHLILIGKCSGMSLASINITVAERTFLTCICKVAKKPWYLPDIDSQHLYHLYLKLKCSCCGCHTTCRCSLRYRSLCWQERHNQAINKPRII